MNAVDTADLDARVQALLAEHDPATSDQREFLGAQYDAGLAWVHLPHGFGGLDLPRTAQERVDAQLAAAGAPVGGTVKNFIGMGMAAPTIAAFGSDEQKRKFLRPLFTGEHVYCQLFSEPGAGSDLAGVATRAVRDGDEWIVNGQKVWTSMAQHAQMAILVARTDPTVPKHAGLTYFLCDMTQPGVEVRPLRQITGEAEFNEVFLTDVRVPDANRLGPEGGGWRVATTTLNNERVAIGSRPGVPREGGIIGRVTEAWRDQPGLRNPAMHDELMRLWVEAEVLRLAGERQRQQVRTSRPARTRRRRHEGGFFQAGTSDLGLRHRAACRVRTALRRLDHAQNRSRRPDRTRARIPLPAGTRQLDRGRHVGNPAQHDFRADPRPAR